jgi:hypothetical protein
MAFPAKHGPHNAQLIFLIGDFNSWNRSDAATKFFWDDFGVFNLFLTDRDRP